MYRDIETKVIHGGLRENFAEDCNAAMENSPAEWVILLNDDVFLACNPFWHDLVQKAIENAENIGNPGLLSCVTSGRRPKQPQFTGIIRKNHNIEQNIESAKKFYYKHGSKVRKIGTGIGREWYRIAHFFVVIKKEAWQEVKFDPNVGNGMDKVDYVFNIRLVEAGYDMFIMPGLFVYHKKRMRKLRDSWKKME